MRLLHCPAIACPELSETACPRLSKLVSLRAPVLLSSKLDHHGHGDSSGHRVLSGPGAVQEREAVFLLPATRDPTGQSSDKSCPPSRSHHGKQYPGKHSSLQSGKERLRGCNPGLERWIQLRHCQDRQRSRGAVHTGDGSLPHSQAECQKGGRLRCRGTVKTITRLM